MGRENEQLTKQKVVQRKQEQGAAGKEHGDGGLALSSGDMLALQGMVGNTAVGQLGQVQRAPQDGGQLENASQAAFQNIVQRTPSNGAGNFIQRLPAVDTLPAPKANRTGIKATLLGAEQSTRYRPVYQAVQQFHQGVSIPVERNDKQVRRQQMEAIMQLYDEVITRAETYIAEAGNKLIGGDTKLNAVTELLRIATRERVAFLEAGMAMVRQRFVPRGTRWSFVIDAINTNQDLAAPDRVQMNEGNFQREVGGAMNRLQVYDQDNMTGFFKANQNRAASPVELNQMMDDPGRRDEYVAADNLRNIGVDTLGMDANNLQLQNRDLAMSRLDALLGANVISRTELALRRNGAQEIQGSLGAEAPGRAAGDRENWEGGETININDGELQRQLSKLQVIDAIARQVDRHMGNFYLARDENGRVTKVTGIDNDMAFGSRDASIHNNLQFDQYPFVTAFVDKEIALRIMRITPEDIGFILNGLLPPVEVQQTIRRLVELQAHLQELHANRQLLEPNDWNEATAQGLIEEGQRIFDQVRARGYYAKLAHSVNG